MAEEIQIAGTPATAKIRSPWAAALLPIVTLGIYYFVWYYKINREMRDLGRARNTDELGDSPGTSLLAVTLGALVIVPAIISVVHTAQRIQKAQRLVGIEQLLSGWLSLVLYLLIAPAFWAYQQSELNKVWRAGGEPPRVEAGEAAPTDVGPGSTTPSQTEFR
jgi:Zn-dependent protease with chaperone function